MAKLAKDFTYVCACCGDVTAVYARTRVQLAEKLQDLSQDTPQACTVVGDALWRGFLVTVPGGFVVPGRFTGKTLEQLLTATSVRLGA
jgi:hypothetical protein